MYIGWIIFISLVIAFIPIAIVWYVFRQIGMTGLMGMTGI